MLTSPQRHTPSTRSNPRRREERAALEQRRREAAKLFERGAGAAEVGHALGVTRQSARRWFLQWAEGGVRALRAAERMGTAPRLNATDLRRLERALLRGAIAHGFPNDLWTLKRIAIVVERLTGHHFSEGHLWRVLRAMNWSPQRPRRRASERNEEALEQWRTKEWARIKKRQTP